MRWTKLVGALVALGMACASSPAPPRVGVARGIDTLVPGKPDDARARRAALEASLVEKNNGYSRVRLGHYATGEDGDWDALPEHNPPAVPWGVRGERPTPLVVDDAAMRGDLEALRRLGEVAFFRYPAQVSSAIDAQVTDAAAAARFGFWVDDTRGIGGLVEVGDGRDRHLAYSCASCHTARRGDALVIGVGNPTIDVGKMMAVDSPFADAYLAWGPGRVDVTTVAGVEPVRIPDLRPTRDLSFLHHTASVRQNDLTSLALRLETLIIVSNGKTTRPPRIVALALAVYLWSLADALPTAPLPTAPPREGPEARGAATFAAACASCHPAPHYGGGAVPIEVVGTDPRLGRSSDRGTGNYRVPSLRGVSTRGALLHDASVPDVATMFDPRRLDRTWRSPRGGPVIGHRFGLDLTDADREDLLAFLRTL